MRLLSFVFAATLSGCALVSGLSDVKVCTNCDGGAMGAEGGAEAGSEAAAPCPQSCGTPPDGWQALTKTRTVDASCGARVVADWYSSVGNGTGDALSVCPCSCTVNQPTCFIGGDLSIKDGDNCALTDSVQISKCAPMNSATVSSAYMISPVPPSGGSCGAPSTAPIIANVTKTTTRTCAMPNGCSGSPCPSADEKACIVHPGVMTCPADFPVSMSVGSDIAATCACNGPCAFSATCDNQALHFYSDMLCMNEVSQAPADGTCHANGAQGKAFGSYQYIATPNGLCKSTPGMATVDVTNKSTLCCKN